MKNYPNRIYIFSVWAIICLCVSTGTFQIDNSRQDMIEHWKAYEVLISENKTRDALGKLEEIERLGLKNGYRDWEIKAFSRRMVHLSGLEEDGLNAALISYNERINKSEKPIALLFSFYKAALLNSYYLQRQYIIDQRVSLDKENANPDYWSKKKYEQEIESAFIGLIEGGDELRSMPSKDFSALLTNPDNSSFCEERLYPQLLKVALNYYENKFRLKNNFYLSKASSAQIFQSSKDFSNDAALDTFTDEHLKQIFTLQQSILREYESDAKEFYTQTDIQRINFARQLNNAKYFTEAYVELLESGSQYGNDYNGPYILARAELAISQANEKDSQQTKLQSLKKAMELLEEVELSKHNIGNCKTLAHNKKLSLLNRQLNIQTETVAMTGENVLIGVDYKGINKVKIHIYKWTENDIAKWSSIYDNKLKLKYFLLKKKEREISVDLKLPDLLLSHYTHTYTENLSPGNYMIVSHGNSNKDLELEDVVCFKQITVSNLALSKSNLHNESLYVLVDRKEGKPIQNALVEVFQQSWGGRNNKLQKTKIEEGRTDKDGSYIYDRPRTNGRIHLEFSIDGDRVSSDALYNHADNRRKTERSIILLDRAIYRPGQTVFYKAILLNSDYHKEHSLLKNIKHELKVTDASGNEIHKTSLLTNDYGSVNGEFKLPNNGLSGNFIIRIGNQSKSFKVEEYKRPTFKVKISNPEGLVKIGDVAKVKLNASAYAGYPIENARVRYKVKTAQYQPWWIYHRQLNQTGNQISSGEILTDENGSAYIAFDALPFNPTFWWRSNAQSTFSIEAEVIDESGELVSKSHSFVIGNGEYNVELSGNSNYYQLNSVLKNTLEIKNEQGEEQASDFSIKVEKLTVPKEHFRTLFLKEADLPILSDTQYKTLFPSIDFVGKNKKENLESSVLVGLKQFKSKSTISFNDFLPRSIDPSEYRIIISLKTAEGKNQVVEKYFSVVSPQRKTESLSDIKLVSNLETAEPGEKVSIDFAGYSKSKYSFLQVITEDRIIFNGWYPFEKPFTFNVEERDRGGIQIQTWNVQDNTKHFSQKMINIPWSNKKLSYEWKTFRDKMEPGEKTTWELIFKDYSGQPFKGEVLLSMYDAALDYYIKDAWQFNLYHSSQLSKFHWYLQNFNISGSSNLIKPGLPYKTGISNSCNGLENPFRSRGIYFADAIKVSATRSRRTFGRNDGAESMAMEAAGNAMEMASSDMDVAGDANAKRSVPDQIREPMQSDNDQAELSPRTNFDETAFFYPDLKANSKGEVSFGFTLPESLTEWNFRALAHGTALESVLINEKIEARQDFMIQAVLPRFLRTGDEIVVQAKVINLSEEAQGLTCSVLPSDPLTEEPLSLIPGNQSQSINLDAGESKLLSWTLNLDGLTINQLKLNFTAKGSTKNDGESHVLALLKDQALVRESRAIYLEPGKSMTLDLDVAQRMLSQGKLEGSKLELIENPLWNVLKSLPYLNEYPYDCSEQLFSKYFANRVARHIVEGSPSIQQTLKNWSEDKGGTLVSRLEENQKLKNILLSESPWLADAKSIRKQMQEMLTLTDLGESKRKEGELFQRLVSMQLSDGGFPWFKGGKSSAYITQHILSGLLELENQGIDLDQGSRKLIASTGSYLHRIYDERYKKMKRQKGFDPSKDYFSSNEAHLLYTLSLDKQDVFKNPKAWLAFWMSQADTYGDKLNIYGRTLLAHYYYESGKSEQAHSKIEGLVQNLTYNKLIGSYFKRQRGYRWYHNNLETHSFVLLALKKISPQHAQIVKMEQWLLSNKRGNHWNSTKATTLACLALLKSSEKELVDGQLEMQVGKARFNLEEYRRSSQGAIEIDLMELDLISSNEINIINSGKRASWVSLHWSYTEELDDIDSFQGEVSVKRTFVRKPVSEKETATTLQEGDSIFKGDKILVHLELESIQDLDYVHLKDQRGAGFDPGKTLSGHKGGHGFYYYQDTKDASTNFFLEELPIGKHVFEYEVNATHSGTFSMGICNLQSLYAPEFSAHSEGLSWTIY